MPCSVCNVDDCKYKCPVCCVPYCSVVCCQKHKETPCTTPDKSQDVENISSELGSYQYPTEDTVPVEKLEMLTKSTEIKKCLANPHLRAMLKTLDSGEAQFMQKCMLEPIFTEFVDECLKILDPEK